jgi:hypothetical protein
MCPPVGVRSVPRWVRSVSPRVGSGLCPPGWGQVCVPPGGVRSVPPGGVRSVPLVGVRSVPLVGSGLSPRAAPDLHPCSPLPAQSARPHGCMASSGRTPSSSSRGASSHQVSVTCPAAGSSCIARKVAVMQSLHVGDADHRKRSRFRVERHVNSTAACRDR